MSSFLYIVPENIDFVKFFTDFIAQQINIDANIVTTSEFLAVIDESIGIDKTRQVMQFIFLKPIEKPYKVVLIAPFDQATVPAQNSMLKVLEEHPDYAYIVLIAKGLGNILDTIKSRCVIRHVDKQALKRLENVKILTPAQKQFAKNVNLQTFLKMGPEKMFNSIQSLKLDKHDMFKLLNQLEDYIAKQINDPVKINNMLQDLQVFYGALQTGYPPKTMLKILTVFFDKYDLFR